MSEARVLGALRERRIASARPNRGETHMRSTKSAARASSSPSATASTSEATPSSSGSYLPKGSPEWARTNRPSCQYRVGRMRSLPNIERSRRRVPCKCVAPQPRSKQHRPGPERRVGRANRGTEYLPNPPCRRGGVGLARKGNRRVGPPGRHTSWAARSLVARARGAPHHASVRAFARRTRFDATRCARWQWVRCGTRNRAARESPSSF